MSKGKFSKGVVIFSVVAVLVFTAVTFFFVWHGRYIPDSIVYSFYGMFGVELSALAGIKITKAKSNNPYGELRRND